MSRWHIRNWGIRSRVLFLAVVPVFFATVLLSGYFVHVRLQDVSQGLQDRGRLLARHLAPASEFGLFAGNRSMLKTAADAAIRQPDVHVVTIVGAEGELVVQSQRDADTEPGGAEIPSQLLAFSEPVRKSGVDLAAVGEQLPVGSAEGPAPIIGWVVVGMDTTGVAARQREILYNTLLIVAAALVLGVLLARRIGRGVAGPVVALHGMVTRFGGGDLNARTGIDTGGELGQLARSVDQMAESLQYAQGRLEQRVEEATAELRATVSELERKNRELEEAREAALRAGREKAEFLANMSHEIRTPVNAVIGFTDLLGRTPLAGEQKEYARTIQQAGHQLIRIIDDILDISKLEAGSVEPERVAFSPRDALQDLLVMLRPAANDKGLELVLALEPGVPDRVCGDPARFRQVLTNLINNAIKFTDRGSVEVTAGYRATAGDEGWLRVTVRDTGIGIDAEQRRRLFWPFAQADASISRRFGGTGLGLVIADRLVGLMDGRVDLESAPGEGSTFTVELPMATVEAGSPAAAPAGDVLLYEPHPAARRAVTLDLLGLGYDVREVDRLEAFRGPAEGGADPATVVIGLARDDAVAARLQELTARVRGEYAGPILFLVGTEEGRALQEAVAAPRVRVLPKPARLETLAAALRELADGVAPEDADPADAPAETTAGLRVLVVEDNDFNRQLMVTLLQQEGAKVSAAADGGSALQRLAGEPFDLVFMDVHMPHMDGIEATRRIREEVDGGAALPVIAVTADVFAEERARLDEAGVDGWLFKPISEEGLREVLQRWAPRTSAPEVAADERAGSAERPAAIPERLWGRLMTELPEHAARLEAAFRGED
ncbi:MAG TPA: ATP-binding protein, partial [Gammaproteobacteria bacterium]|nr:ATP-binding protein [Gammaproteobacteria bacterium]